MMSAKYVEFFKILWIHRLGLAWAKMIRSRPRVSQPSKMPLLRPGPPGQAGQGHGPNPSLRRTPIKSSPFYFGTFTKKGKDMDSERADFCKSAKRKWPIHSSIPLSNRSLTALLRVFSSSSYFALYPYYKYLHSCGCISKQQKWESKATISWKWK